MADDSRGRDMAWRPLLPQVPSRVPVLVNVTLPGENVNKRECNDISTTTPIYRTVMKTVYENRTREECKQETIQKCLNFTLPVFEKVNPMFFRL